MVSGEMLQEEYKELERRSCGTVKQMTTVSSDELINMLTNAVKGYGNRPVFVEVNNHRYIINDLEFTANGKDFKLILT